MFYLVFFIFGCFVGSFLLVLIDRIPREETVWKGRSHCDMCKHKLYWYDLIPIVSYSMLSGRCRYCKKAIGEKYPLIELITGLSFVATFLLFQVTYHVSGITYHDFFQLGFYILLASSFIVIFFTDFWYGIIPDAILIPTTFIVFLYEILNTKYEILPYLLSAIGASLFFLIITLVTRGKGMGLGDVKLAFFMGLLLGFPRIVVALYIAFLTGALVSLILILMHKKKLRGDTIAFGPFLIIGTILSLYFGDMIWSRFLAQFLI